VRFLAVLGLGFCLLGALPARAAPPAETEVKTPEQLAAREAFQRGEKAFKSGEYEQALAAFREAFAAVSHDAVRFNIAVCLERLGRFSEAAEQYDAAAKSSLLDQADRARARRSAKTARASLGTVVMESGTPGTPVSVDTVERCRIPCRVALDPGRHQVSIGANPALSIDVERGREHVMVPPRPASPAAAPKPEKSRAPSAERKPVSEPRGPGFLTWTGGALAVAGTASTLYFGLRAQSLHDDYVREPTEERYDDGTRARLLTNLSLGVLAVGAVLVAVDLFLLAPRERTPVLTGARARAGLVEW
jgi:hypothetical protein